MTNKNHPGYNVVSRPVLCLSCGRYHRWYYAGETILQSIYCEVEEENEEEENIRRKV